MLDFNRFEVLTFDCYGTLIDWEMGIIEALRPILASHDLFPGDEELLALYAEAEAKAESGGYIRYREVLRRAFESVLVRLGVHAVPAELDLVARSLPNWPPFDDTIEALAALKRGFKLAVISNTDDDLFALTAQTLRTPFDWVVTAEQVRAYKPSAANFDYALRRIGVPKEKVLHVAQSLHHDIATAKRLGWSAVWVNRRAGRAGSGATPAAQAAPDLEVPDLKTLVSMAAAR